MYSFKLFLLGILIFSIYSCKTSTGESKIDTSKIEFSSPLIRIDSTLFGCESKEEILVFLNKYQSVTIPYFGIQKEDLPKLAENLLGFISNPALRQFYKNSINTANGIKVDSLQNEINEAFKKIKHHYPDIKTPKIYTAFTGFSGKDLLVTDSVIVIGLDFFVGKTAQYRPQVYDYQLNKYVKENIVVAILNNYATKYAKADPADNSLLTDMLFYGKCFQFTKTMLPNAPDSLIIGYSQNQLNETEISQEMVWGHFIDQKLLFENNPFKKSKYLDEKPSVLEISPDCPGMIGRWLGWKIIKKYQENNKEYDFKNMMATKNGQELFEKSKYKGKGDIDK